VVSVPEQRAVVGVKEELDGQAVVLLARAVADEEEVAVRVGGAN
jgi:hypothetical protein